MRQSQKQQPAQEQPSRRDLLNLAVRAAALPGGAQFMAAWLSKGLKGADQHDHAGHSAQSGPEAAQSGPEAAQSGPKAAPPELPLLRDYRPKFFNPEDFAALQGFTEVLIPSDGTPGAREALCAHYIDFLLDAAGQYAPQMQTQWRRAMEDLRQAGFHTADGKGREALIEAMSRPERDAGARHPAFDAYRLIKQLNTFAFYTSRTGTIEVLDYKGNSYNATFPACTHPEHQKV